VHTIRLSTSKVFGNHTNQTSESKANSAQINIQLNSQ